MTWSEISWKPTRKILRQFAGLWIVFFIGLACYHGIWHERLTLALILGISGIIIGPLGLFFPALIRPIYIGWMVLVFPIGWTVSRIILALLFFLVFTPFALFFRLVGRDALRRSRTGKKSYWEPKAQPKGAAGYFQQF